MIEALRKTGAHFAGKDFGGFWADIRSKRDIQGTDLNPDTCDNFNFFDPLLTPTVPPLTIRPPFNFRSATGSRPWLLGLHSWRFADYWIMRSLKERDVSGLTALNLVACDYIKSIWNAHDRARASEFVMGDTSVAARGAALAFLLSAEGWRGFRIAERDLLESALREHVNYAMDDANFNSNNHGILNDLSLCLAFGNYPRLKDTFDFSKILQRIKDVFLGLQISEEFIHLEHTPSYSALWIILGNKITIILGKFFGEDPSVTELLNEIVSAVNSVRNNLYWFVTPKGELVNLGEQGRKQGPKWVREIPGEKGLRLFSKSGYAAYKADSSYLLMAGAYHATKLHKSGYRSSSHKQRDELHVLWSESMGNILVDSGFKSFEYDDARRYVISKQAHNTLSFELSDYMNKDNIIAYMDRTSPYGSSITGAALADGLVVMHGVDALLARQNILHVRSAVLDPGKWLLIIDFVKSNVRQELEWNFHFDQCWECIEDDGTVQLKHRDGASNLLVTRLSNEPVTSKAQIYRGSEKPLRGWAFQPATPIFNVSYVESCHALNAACYGTVFALGGCQTRPVGVKAARVNNQLVFDVDIAVPAARRLRINSGLCRLESTDRRTK
jgi:hypothetical protein